MVHHQVMDINILRILLLASTVWSLRSLTIDWEPGLREATHQALVREGITGPGIREGILDAPILGKEDTALPFGDVAALARGKLFYDRDGFKFVQERGSCGGCIRETLLALWSVKRIRHRHRDGYQFEVEYTIVPMTGEARIDYERPGHVFIVKINEGNEKRYLPPVDRLSHAPAFLPSIDVKRKYQESQKFVPSNHYIPGDRLNHPFRPSNFPPPHQHYLPYKPTTTQEPSDYDLFNELLESLAKKTSTTKKDHRFKPTKSTKFTTQKVTSSTKFIYVPGTEKVKPSKVPLIKPSNAWPDKTTIFIAEEDAGGASTKKGFAPTKQTTVRTSETPPNIPPTGGVDQELEKKSTTVSMIPKTTGGFKPSPSSTSSMKTGGEINGNGMVNVQTNLINGQKGQSHLISGQNGQAHFNNGQTQLNGGQTQLSNGQTQLSNGQMQISNGHTQLSNGQTQLSNGQTQLSNGQTHLSGGQTQLSNGQMQISNGQTQLSNGQTQLSNGQMQLSGGQPSNGQTQISNGHTQLSNGQTQLSHGQTQLMNGQTTAVYPVGRKTTKIYPGNGKTTKIYPGNGKTTPVYVTGGQVYGQTTPVFVTHGQTTPVYLGDAKTTPVYVTSPIYVTKTTPVYIETNSGQSHGNDGQTTLVHGTNGQTTLVHGGNGQTTPVYGGNGQTTHVYGAIGQATQISTGGNKVINGNKPTSSVYVTDGQTRPNFVTNGQTSPAYGGNKPIINGNVPTTPVYGETSSIYLTNGQTTQVYVTKIPIYVNGQNYPTKGEKINVVYPKTTQVYSMNGQTTKISPTNGENYSSSRPSYTEVPKYTSNKPTYSTNGEGYSTNGEIYSTQGGIYSTNGGTYSNQGGSYSTQGGSYSTHGGTYSTHGGTYPSNEGTYSTNGQTYSTNGQTDDLNRPTYSTNGATYSSDGQTYSTTQVYQSNGRPLQQPFPTFASFPTFSTNSIYYTTQTRPGDYPTRPTFADSSMKPSANFVPTFYIDPTHPGYPKTTPTTPFTDGYHLQTGQSPPTVLNLIPTRETPTTLKLPIDTERYTPPSVTHFITVPQKVDKIDEFFIKPPKKPSSDEDYIEPTLFPELPSQTPPAEVKEEQPPKDQKPFLTDENGYVHKETNASEELFEQMPQLTTETITKPTIDTKQIDEVFSVSVKPLEVDREKDAVFDEFFSGNNFISSSTERNDVSVVPPGAEAFDAFFGPKFNANVQTKNKGTTNRNKGVANKGMTNRNKGVANKGVTNKSKGTKNQNEAARNQNEDMNQNEEMRNENEETRNQNEESRAGTNAKRFENVLATTRRNLETSQGGEKRINGGGVRGNGGGREIKEGNVVGDGGRREDEITEVLTTKRVPTVKLRTRQTTKVSTRGTTVQPMTEDDVEILETSSKESEKKRKKFIKLSGGEERWGKLGESRKNKNSKGLTTPTSNSARNSNLSPSSGSSSVSSSSVSSSVTNPVSTVWTSTSVTTSTPATTSPFSPSSPTTEEIKVIYSNFYVASTADPMTRLDYFTKPTEINLMNTPTDFTTGSDVTSEVSAKKKSVLDDLTLSVINHAKSIKLLANETENVSSQKHNRNETENQTGNVRKINANGSGERRFKRIEKSEVKNVSGNFKIEGRSRNTTAKYKRRNYRPKKNGIKRKLLN